MTTARLVLPSPIPPPPRSPLTATRSPRQTRIRSVRTKPTSFSGWRESVRSACQGEDLDLVVRGTPLWKVRRKPLRGLACYQREFRLDLDSMCIQCSSEGGGSRWLRRPGRRRNWGDRCSVDIANVCEVRTGFSTDTFNEVEKRAAGLKISSFINMKHCFSVIFNPELSRKSLDLVARDKHTCQSWVRTLKRIINATKSIEIQKEYELYLRNQFHTADDNRNGYLTINEFAGLLQQLNIHLTEKDITQIFDEVNTDRTEIDGEQVIDEFEFLEFYHNLLERTELNVLFRQYSKRFDGLAMTAAELKEFLETEQKMEVTETECCLIISEFEPSQARNKRSLLSSEGFSRFFLFSDLHDIIDHSKTESVYQEMDHPLSHYYISTSHNTYLVGNQMTSESSIDGYIRALKAGCRCVELDCWDGPMNEPVIYHGWTLTSKLDFKEVLNDAVKPYAFYASEYPLILSIENHCSKKQQDRMAELLTTILGDLLLTEPVDRSRSLLPSPKELKKRILIKAKKIHRQTSSKEMVPTHHFECPEESESSTASDSTSLASALQLQYHRDWANTRRKHSDSTDSVDTVSKRFSDLVNYCESTKFRGFDGFPRRYWEMSSFDETRALQLSSQPANFVNYNKRNLSRVYPRGTRVLSTNFDPLAFWLAGCQMVALNYQAKDRPLMFSRAMFRQNARCGYVLKPRALRENRTRDCAKQKLLTIKIISGQHLPKSEQRIKGDIIEPYVKVRVHGHPADEAEYITKIIPKNGFNPTWNETATFTISHPSLCFVEFNVRSGSSSSSSSGNSSVVGQSSPDGGEHVGSYVIALQMMRLGYRSVYLENYAGVRLTPASLFVHVSLGDVD